jgi:hypothetical protein
MGHCTRTAPIADQPIETVVRRTGRRAPMPNNSSVMVTLTKNSVSIVRALPQS